MTEEKFKEVSRELERLSSLGLFFLEENLSSEDIFIYKTPDDELMISGCVYINHELGFEEISILFCYLRDNLYYDHEPFASWFERCPPELQKELAFNMDVWT